MTAQQRAPISVTAAEAVVFDLDGVLTDTAAVHRRAWSAMFTEFLADHAPQSAPYTDVDYFTLVDGKSRADGVRAVLASRGIDLPEGRPDDADDAVTVHGLGNRKNTAFGHIVDTEGVHVFPGSRDLVNALRAARVPMAVVSSSKNARTALEHADLLGAFTGIVDGQVTAQRGLPGKPEPDMFLLAARLLGVEPHRSIAVEDAISGVQSASRAGYWVVGVDRGVGAAQLAAEGADDVVTDLAQLLPTGHSA